MKNKFAERLKNLMELEGITAYKLSKDLHVSQSVVMYWLQGKTTPSIEYLIDVADYFNVCSDYLLGRQENY